MQRLSFGDLVNVWGQFAFVIDENHGIQPALGNLTHHSAEDNFVLVNLEGRRVVRYAESSLVSRQFLREHTSFVHNEPNTYNHALFCTYLLMLVQGCSYVGATEFEYLVDSQGDLVSTLISPVFNAECHANFARLIIGPTQLYRKVVDKHGNQLKLEAA